ncbi:MAG: helix-turn-helix transcriptional regulator [Lentisphaerae bacterium]|nr:helix-turn-helix transcriptional regulator [Lentisphaerota bacterium]
MKNNHYNMKIEKICDICSCLTKILEHGFDLSLQGANSRSDTPEFYNWHMHKFWELKIHYPENPDQKYHLTIVPPGVIHCMTKREMTLDITHHCITVTGEKNIWQIFPDNDPDKNRNLLPELLHLITRYSDIPDYASLCIELTAGMLKNLQLLIKNNIDSPKPARPPRDIVTHALNYMNNCYFKVDLSISEIASFLGITPQYLNKIIHRATGKTTRKNLMEIRLKHARELLENTNYLVKEVATLTGWRSQFYFSNVFRAAYGVSPNEIAGNIKNNLTVIVPTADAKGESRNAFNCP